VGFTSPSGAATVTVGQPTAVQLGAAPATARSTVVHWQVSSDAAGLTVTPASGSLTLGSEHAPDAAAGGACASSPATASLTVAAAQAGTFTLRVLLTTTAGVALPPVVIDVSAQP
jgi:hypothetical protein